MIEVYFNIELNLKNNNADFMLVLAKYFQLLTEENSTSANV